jgi:thiamine pyrophosphokinase
MSASMVPLCLIPGLADLFDERSPTSLIVLDSKEKSSADPLPMIWAKAGCITLADGAANNLVKRTSLGFAKTTIVGDGDSITHEAVRFFRDEMKIPVLLDPTDQDSNDLVKCLRHVKRHAAKEPASALLSVYIFGAFGGRFDHEMANLGALYDPEFADCFKQIVLLGEDSLACLIPGGKKACSVSVVSPLEGPKCGLLPLGGPSEVSTTGLHWNLDNTKLSFGVMLSTSNWIDSVYPYPSDGSLPREEKALASNGTGAGSEVKVEVHRGAVTITSSAPIIWTTQLHWGSVLKAWLDCQKEGIELSKKRE